MASLFFLSQIYWGIIAYSNIKFAYSKFSKSDFKSMWTMNFQMFKLDLEKAEEPDQIVNICWIIKKQESSIKTSTSVLLTTPKPLTV